MTNTDKDSNKRVCVGVVTGAHGLRGLVRVLPYTDVPEDVGAYGPVETEDGQASYELDIRNRTGKGQILVQIDGVDDRNAAEALKSVKFYVPRERLPEAEEEEFYYADLVGLRVLGQDDSELGTVRAVQNFGAGDMLEINDTRGGVSTIPFTRAAVPEVDISGARVVVDAAQILRAGSDKESGA